MKGQGSLPVQWRPDTEHYTELNEWMNTEEIDKLKTGRKNVTQKGRKRGDKRKGESPKGKCLMWCCTAMDCIIHCMLFLQHTHVFCVMSITPHHITFVPEAQYQHVLNGQHHSVHNQHSITDPPTTRRLQTTAVNYRLHWNLFECQY